MVAQDRPDPNNDPFHPPELPIEVECLHCGQEYDSYLIEWREELDAEGKVHGFWCCPTPGCDGKGFGFDILPTDPDYRDERGGWVSFDDEDEEFDEDELEEEFNAEGFEDLGGGLRPPPRSGNGNGDGPLGPGDIGDDEIPF